MAGSTAALGLAVGLVALGTTAGRGGAATEDGIGSSTVTTSVLEASLGDLLELSLLEDVATSTTDPDMGAVGASSVFRRLRLTSTITGGLPSLNQVVGEHSVSAPVGTPEVNAAALNLDTLALDALADGTLGPLELRAASDTSASTSSATQITSMSLLGGLASLGSLDSTDKTLSGKPAAEAERAMALDALTVLDIGRLLQGLGLDALNLPLSVVSGLVTSLGIDFDLRGATSFSALVQGLIASIDALQNTLDAVVTETLLGAIGGVGLPVVLQPALGATITDSVIALQRTLADAITSAVSLIEAATLLKVNALEVDTLAKASDTVAASVATATGKIESIEVGPTVLPGVDLDAPGADVAALTGLVQTTLGNVLAPLGFTDLLAVELFDRTTGVTESGGVVTATASITGLSITLTAPSLDALDDLDDPDGGIVTLIPVILDNGRTAPRRSRAAQAAQADRMQANAVPANPLTGVLGEGLDGDPLLSRGMALRLGTVESSARQAVPDAAPEEPTTTTPTTTTPTAPTTTPPTSTPGTSTPSTVRLSTPLTPASQTPATPTVTNRPRGTLPATGGEQTLFAILAMGLGAAALGVRGLRRRAET